MATTASDQQIVQVPIYDLRPDPANPRKISDRKLDLDRGAAMAWLAP
jgi:hypothetical protein